MLAIRLQRIGKKNRPHYRLVVSEKSKDLYGKHLEILGNYDPISKPKIINLNPERIKYWLSVGAKASDTVHNILVSNKIIESEKIKAWKPKKKTNGKDDPKSDEKKEEIKKQ
jgi:small subunit ribosomal protein S16